MTKPATREHIVLNYRNAGPLEFGFTGGKVLVDGKEIHSVWYVDTREGIVKSYDIDLNGGKPQASFTGWVGYPIESPRLANCELPADQLPVEDAGGILSITLRGRIELYYADGKRIF